MDGRSERCVFLFNDTATTEIYTLSLHDTLPISIRMDGWKLVRAGRKKGKWELYRINKDRVELNNLAAKHPDKVKALAAEWTAWRTHTRGME